MVLLRENFIQLQIIGLWSPVVWPTDSFKSRAYWFYTAFLITATYWFGITEFVNLFVVVDSIDDFSDNSFMLLTTIVVCFKIDMILSKKSEVVALVRTFETYPHEPINTDEESICEKFNARIRLISSVYGGLGEVSVFTMTISVFFQGIPYGDLPYKAWIPYDYSTPILYWFTFSLQLLVVIFLASVAFGFDTVLIGLFTLICAQFNMLKNRLEKAIDEFKATEILKSQKETSDAAKICENRIKHCIKYHRAIFEYVG
ncbi:uncharacterized protein [Fopius arisanus]|uniref:Odorant receptor n=1 Tax=Fopius arisanus TaxID=64838 RepID=A0A9R1U8Q6_9HYME|nr:PREDICTED: uncharacterized protein LOC105271410 [Fopius arisanus]